MQIYELHVHGRFLFLRPLSGKTSFLVAEKLLNIYSIVGPPARIQTDKGSEFRGAVEMLASNMGKKMIRSNPYHPQSQGKVV
jgi:hypothetical protein